jgi:hypothetical protein
MRSCAACAAFDAAERAAFQDEALPSHELACMCASESLDVLYVSLDRFRRTPQVGVACRVTWRELAGYLTHPTIADAKDAAGAWSPATYRGNVRRKSNLVLVGALVIDVDDGGDVERVAEALQRYRAIIHSTFSSTSGSPRCRIVLALAEPIDAPTYSRTHAVVRWHLGRAGILADEGAKDPSRLSYAPVMRPDTTFRCRVVEGPPLCAHAVLAAQTMSAPPSQRRASPSLGRVDAYVRSALSDAASAIASADPGARHYTLSRESFALARLSLAEHEIVAALLPAFLVNAGDARRAEGLRTIHDAVRERRGGA